MRVTGGQGCAETGFTSQMLSAVLTGFRRQAAAAVLRGIAPRRHYAGQQLGARLGRQSRHTASFCAPMVLVEIARPAEGLHETGALPGVVQVSTGRPARGTDE